MTIILFAIDLYRFITTLLQMLDLYCEVLYGIEYGAGCDVNEKEERDVLLQYLQEVFKMDSQKHTSLLEKAKTRKVCYLYSILITN